MNGTNGMTGQLAVWHYRDWLVHGEQVALCGIPLPPEPVGVVQPCEACLAERKRRQEAGRA